MKRIESLKINKKFVTVFSLFAAGFISLNLIESFSRRIFYFNKKNLESKLEVLLNKKVLLGEYSKLGFLGFSITDTQIIDENSDEIELKVRSINFRILPIRSILNRKWSLQISPNNLRISLSEDYLKDFSEFDSTNEINTNENNNDPQFKYELYFNIRRDSIISIPESGINANINGELIYNSTGQQLFGSFKSFFRSRGNLQIKFNTKLNQNIISFKVFTTGLRLDDFTYSILDENIYFLQGDIKSNFSFFRTSNDLKCSGNLFLNDLNIDTSKLNENINANSLDILCRDNNLTIKTNNLTYGTLTSDLKLDIPFINDKSNIVLEGQVGYINSVNPEINISGLIPYWISEEGLNFGNLDAEFNLNRTQLSNLNFFRNNGIRGYITAKGFITGDLFNPISSIEFNIEYPHYKGIRIREIFDGKIINDDDGYILTMNNRSSPIPSFLSMNLDSKFGMRNLEFSRLFDSEIGSLIIERQDDYFVWAATKFPFNEIELSLRDNEFESINGSIDGSGIIYKDQSYIDGRFSLILGEYRNIKLADSIFEFAINDELIDIKASLFPNDGGSIDINYQSNNDDSITFDFNSISFDWTGLTAFDILNFKNNRIIPKGDFNDLKNIEISNELKTLDDQLKMISQLTFTETISSNKKVLNNFLNKIEGRYDANIIILGSDISNYEIQANLEGYINDNNSSENNTDYFNIDLEGGLFKSEGKLNITQLPLSISNLIFESPRDISGTIDLILNYNLDQNKFSSFISSNNTSINGYDIQLDETKINFQNSLFDVDLSLFLNNSGNPIKLEGTIPIALGDQFNLRLNGDEKILNLLDNLTNKNFTFNSGEGNLRMIISGNLDKPIANGFFFLKDGNINIFNNTFKDINSTIIFDFEQLDFIDFSAKDNESGLIFISGSLPFYNESGDENNVNFIATDFRLSGNNFNFIFNSNVNIANSFSSPLIGGGITLSNGYINFKGSNNEDNSNNIRLDTQKDLNNIWPELSWGRENVIEIITNESILNGDLLNERLPVFFDRLRFQDLGINIGPEFRVGYGNIFKAYLYTDNQIYLNGNVNDNLNARGLVNIFRARANLYTTPFKQDNNKDNFLVFASRAGINPFISFSLVSKVPDTIIPIIDNNNDTSFSFGKPILSNENSFGSFGIGNTRFIRIEASYSGFLDQLTFEDQNQKILLRSTPSYSRSQIIGLIGGNSANLINRALISHLYGLNAFSERFQLSLYPALIENKESMNNLFSGDTLDSENTSDSSYDNFSSQAWVAELGIDITDSINLAVQATPDRDDLPPLGIITFQVNPSLELLGSFDSNGDWKSQLQIFFRY